MIRSSILIARQHSSAVLIALLGLVTLAGCAREIPPPCPPVRVDSTTGTLTKFREGAGNDLSGVEYQVKIVGFQGECIFDKGEVEVVLDVDFEITSGPAAQAGPVSFYYFAAIPQLFPEPSGKKIFEVQRRLAGGAAAPVALRESNIRIQIPLEEAQPAASFDVYLGLQLSDAQLEFNRRRMQQ